MSNDGTIRLWPAEATPQTLCDKVVTDINQSQWNDWISPDIDYRAVCPGLPAAPEPGAH